MILIKSQLGFKQFFISMVTDISMNDFPTDNIFSGSISKTITFFIPLLRRDITNKSQVHSRVWGHMGGGLILK